MKKTLITLFITFNILFSFAQNGITFKVEELSKPEALLDLTDGQRVIDHLAAKTSRISISDIEKEDLLLANCDIPDSLVFFYDTHPFFNGMYEAFIHHRPFVLSPDMIWLLICQGFSQHVNANSEELRDQIVNFDGKMSLVVTGDEENIKQINWENAIPQFTQQIKKNTKGDLAETIMADFSTTTPTELIATEVTLMEAVQNFFEYVYPVIGCGIPEITLLGTPDDWQKVYDKAVFLSQYQLDWWIDELKPILKQFVEASKGNIDTDFWKAMFRTHSQEGYLAPNLIDGWIIKFFPYNAIGKRTYFKSIPDNKIITTLPSELASADVRVINISTGEETMVELCAGFIGLEQSNSDFALTPKIGWFVKRKIDNNNLDYNKIKNATEHGWGTLVIKDVPDVLNRFDYFHSLNLRFMDSVHMPEWMETKKIDELSIYGAISTEERNKILNWYKQTRRIYINAACYQKGHTNLSVLSRDIRYALKNDSSLIVSVSVDKDNCFYEYIEGLDSINILNIENKHREFVSRKPAYRTVTNMPNEITTTIDTIIFDVEPSRAEKKAIKKLLPNTVIQFDINYQKFKFENSAWYNRHHQRVMNRKYKAYLRQEQKEERRKAKMHGLEE